MAFGDENSAFSCRHDVGRFAKQSWFIAGNAGLTNRHEKVPVATEFANQMSALSVTSSDIGYPDIAVVVDMETMGKSH
jgi:hypothetical protein